MIMLKSTTWQTIIATLMLGIGLISNNLMAQSVGGTPSGGSSPIGTDEIYAVFIPNSFTPNDDGLNDRFLVSSELVKRISMRIYDKTGEEVYATIEMAQGWDGKHHGREMKQDSYLYRIEVDYMDGSNEVIVGQLNLMR